MEQQYDTIDVKRRPGGLTALCILTFIWSGLFTLISLIGMFGAGAFISYFESNWSLGGALTTSIIMVFFFVIFIFNGLSLFGAIKMFKLKKSGFIMYAISNGIMALVLIYSVIIAFTPIAVIYLLISLLFLVLYGLNLKHMS